MSDAAAKWPEVAERIARRIRAGQTAVGDRLPRSRELAQAEGVAERTARKAVLHLERLGVVRVVPNVGTFVATVPPEPLPDLPAVEPQVTPEVVRDLQTEVAQLREQQELTQAQVRELYDRLGQPWPGATSARQHGRGRRSG